MHKRKKYALTVDLLTSSCGQNHISKHAYTNTGEEVDDNLNIWVIVSGLEITHRISNG